MAKALPVQGLDKKASIFANAARIIRTRLDEMRDYERFLATPESSYELHQMRIAAKRLRYTLEIFGEVYAAHTPFGERYAAAVLEIKELQEHLGALHDADVQAPELIAQMARLLKKGYGQEAHGEPIVGVHHVDYDACLGLLTLCQEIRERRDKHYQKLLEDWERLKTEHFFEGLDDLLQAAASEHPAQKRGSRKPR